jgi:hypothetical protein
MDEKRSFAGPILIALALVLFPILYVGAYAVTVGQTLVWSDREAAIVSIRPSYLIHETDYGDYIGPLFYPLHQLDCWLRPTYWAINPERIGDGFDFTIDEHDATASDGSK